MSLSIVTKNRACAELIRTDLALGAGFFLFAGEILAIGRLPPVNQVLPGFLTLFFISGSANISNDYFDRDAMDVKGDQLRSAESLAKRRGRTYAMRMSGVMFGVFFALTLFPFLMGWLGYDYLFLVAVTDLWMIYCSMNLASSRTTEEGRVQIRRLYLAW